MMVFIQNYYNNKIKNNENKKILNKNNRIYYIVYPFMAILPKILIMKDDKKYKAKIYATFLSYLGMLITIIYIIIKSHLLTN